MKCALDGGRRFENREAATTAVAKQSDCQGKCAWHARLAETPSGRASALTMPAVSTSCSLYPLPCPQHAEALMTKRKPGDHTGGRLCQHGTPLCGHYGHATRVRFLITARHSVDQTKENSATGGVHVGLLPCSDGHTGCAELPLAVKAAWLDVARRLCNQACPTVDEVKKVAVAGCAVVAKSEARTPSTLTSKVRLGLSHTTHSHGRTALAAALRHLSRVQLNKVQLYSVTPL